MRQTLLSVAPLLAGMFLLFLGNGALGTLLSLRMAMTGFPSFTAGMVMSAYFMGLVLGTFWGRHLISGVGHIRAFAAFAAIFSAATLAHPFLVAVAPWFALRFVEGLTMSGLFMCTESWLNERASNELRGRVLSLYMIAVYLAQGTGQFLLNLPDPTGFAIFVIASILISLAVVPVAVTRVPAPALPPASRLGFRQLYAISPMGISGAFVAGSILGGFYGLAPYFAHGVGLSIAETAQFMSAAIIGGLLLQWPMGKLSDHVDRRWVMIAMCAGVVIASLALVGATGRTSAGLLVLAMLFGGVAFTLYPLSIAHTNDQIDPADLVPASASLLIAYGFGAVLGPVGAAATMSLMGPAGLFAFITGVAMATAVFAFWRLRQRAAPAAEDKGAFRPVPRTTSVACEMDPRSETAEPTPDLAEAKP